MLRIGSLSGVELVPLVGLSTDATIEFYDTSNPVEC
jgi:hypothetical protein